MIYNIVIIYYEPLYKICIYFLGLFLISTYTFGNGNNISIIIHFVYDSIFMPIIIGLQINIITYHIMLLMELRDEPYRLFQNIDNSNMNDDIMYLLMWITLSMVPTFDYVLSHIVYIQTEFNVLLCTSYSNVKLSNNISICSSCSETVVKHYKTISMKKEGEFTKSHGIFLFQTSLCKKNIEYVCLLYVYLIYIYLLVNQHVRMLTICFTRILYYLSFYNVAVLQYSGNHKNNVQFGSTGKYKHYTRPTCMKPIRKYLHFLSRSITLLNTQYVHTCNMNVLTYTMLISIQQYPSLSDICQHCLNRPSEIGECIWSIDTFLQIYLYIQLIILLTCYFDTITHTISLLLVVDNYERMYWPSPTHMRLSELSIYINRNELQLRNTILIKLCVRVYMLLL